MIRITERLIVAVIGLLIAASVSSGRAAEPVNEVTFDNQSGQTALVKLIGPTQRLVTVPNGEKRTVTATAGDYYIMTRYGDEHPYRYSKGDVFAVKETATTRSAITITLHKVVDGNYPSEPISEAEFLAQGQITPNILTAMAHYERAMTLAKAEEYRKSIAEFDSAIRLYPQWAAAYHDRGVTYGRLGDAEREIGDYNKAIKLDATDPHFFTSRALFHISTNGWAQAIADYDRAIALAPDVALYYARRGNAHARRPATCISLGQAKRDLDEAIRLNPNEAEYHFDRGIVNVRLNSVPGGPSIQGVPLFMKDRLREALEDFGRAIQIDPNGGKYYWWRANIRDLIHGGKGKEGCALTGWMREDEQQELLVDLARAIDLNPEYRQLIRDRNDFKSWWDDPRFQQIMKAKE